MQHQTMMQMAMGQTMKRKNAAMDTPTAMPTIFAVKERKETKISLPQHWIVFNFYTPPAHL